MNNMSLTNLSVMERAARAYAGGNVSDIEELAQKIYPDGTYPFVVSQDFPLPLHLFSPRLAAMLSRDEDHLDATTIWGIISGRDNIIRMITATELQRTAAEILGKQFEGMYPHEQDALNTKRKQMIGYMIKVVMESFGYIVYRNRMQITTMREGADRSKRKINYFSTASRYIALTPSDRDKLSNEIDDKATKAAFKAITDLIINSKTIYQTNYGIERQSIETTV